MKRLKRTEPRTEPWSTLLFTGFHLDLLPLTTTLWVQLFSQFLTHFAVFIQPILQQLIFVNSVEDFRPSWSPVKQYPLLFCQTAHFIVEAYQAGQTWFHLDEFVLTTSDDFLLHVPEMVSRESFSSPFQGSKWGWLACSSLIVLFPWDMGVCLVSSSLWVLLLGDGIKQRLQGTASQWNLPAWSSVCIPSVYMDLWTSDVLEYLCWKRIRSGNIFLASAFPFGILDQWTPKGWPCW